MTADEILDFINKNEKLKNSFNSLHNFSKIDNVMWGQDGRHNLQWAFMDNTEKSTINFFIRKDNYNLPIRIFCDWMLYNLMNIHLLSMFVKKLNGIDFLCHAISNLGEKYRRVNVWFDDESHNLAASFVLWGETPNETSDLIKVLPKFLSAEDFYSYHSPSSNFNAIEYPAKLTFVSAKTKHRQTIGFRFNHIDRQAFDSAIKNISQ